MSPLLYLALLTGAVGLGLPAGALVVAAGALYGPWLGLGVVLIAEAAGLLLNWRLCRGLLRPHVQRWLQRRQQGRWRWLAQLQQSKPGLGVLVLLRLAAIPMTLVNASCALGVTPPRTYALASLMLAPRFALMVLAGGAAAEAGRGSLSPLEAAARLLALLATAALLALLARRALKHRL
jgi:uncharacterized membrane protein YdjX (TVP38/TMEM64 family)